MARHTTALSNFGPNVLPDMWVERTFISALRSNLVVHRLGKPSTLPDHGGKNVRWQFFNNPTANTTAITNEGDDPAETDFTTTKAEATLAEFGGFSDLSRFMLKAAISATMQEFIEGLGYQAAITIDTLDLTELANTSKVIDAGPAVSADTLRQARGQLRGAGQAALAGGRAQPHPATPGGRFFAGVLSEEQGNDMIGEGTPAWFQAKDRDIEGALMLPLDETPATSAIYNVIVKTTSNAQRLTTSSPDDDLGYIVGKEAFGVASLDSNTDNPTVTITTPQQLVSAPARNRGTAAWWILYAVKLIDSNRVIQIKSDATGIG